VEDADRLRTRAGHLARRAARPGRARSPSCGAASWRAH